MGNPVGFLVDKERTLPKNREVVDRIQDFNDVHKHISTDERIEISKKGAARCMDCGVPFCHFSCPLGNLIPEWNDLVYQNQIEDAFVRLKSTNNFPEFTSRLCPALCEKGCVLGIDELAVTIENTEQMISDFGFENNLEKSELPEMLTGKTVAVVGSGPAGLAAADQLSKAGHTVVVFEKDQKIGGILRYGIPNFKLEKELIDRRVKILEEQGVRFKVGIEIGGINQDDLSIKDLQVRFDAVLLTIGTSIPNDLSIPGRELEGVHFAMDFLTNQTRRLFREQVVNENISAENKNVLIIGGGDTGSDCLGTSLRQNAKFVTTLQVLPQPPEKRGLSEFFGSQPWPTYPILNNPSTSILEGEELGKSEVLYQTTVIELIGESGSVKKAKLAKVDNSFKPIAGTEFEIDVDLVLISIGFKAPNLNGINKEETLELTERGLIKTDSKFATNLSHVFAAGDSRRGQSLIVWAIAEGRSAAAEIDNYLTKRNILPKPISPDSKALTI